MTPLDSAQASRACRLALPELLSSEARVILCYPTCERAYEVAQQLQGLGVAAVQLTGKVLLGRYGVLGKGCVGIVVRAELTDGMPVAIKIRRADADRPSMASEAHIMRMANQQQIGPRLIAHSQDVLVMELVEGVDVDEYIAQASPDRIRHLARRILEQCWALDQIGISHGELSTLRKHVIVRRGDEGPVILDFESASLSRKRPNVTAAASYLFVSGPCSPRVRGAVGGLSVQDAIDALKAYKKDQSEASFQDLLRRLRIG